MIVNRSLGHASTQSPQAVQRVSSRTGSSVIIAIGIVLVAVVLILLQLVVFSRTQIGRKLRDGGHVRILAWGDSVTEASYLPAETELQPSLDVTQRLGSNVLASVTVNTDFAETEVDTRRTNLTRFPLFFPEKRTFFLEGADIFSFGLGLGEDLLPYFSRRIGLVDGREVPIIAGTKVNGRVGNTNFGGLVVGTDEEPGVVDQKVGMAVGRVKRNVWRESWVGAIATVGDPLGRPGSWLGGADFTFTLVPAIKVLAVQNPPVDASTGKSSAGTSTFVLDLSPADATTIVYATDHSTLYMGLLPPENENGYPIPGVAGAPFGRVVGVSK